MAKENPRGASRLLRRLRTIREGVGEIVSRSRLEQFLLRRVQRRIFQGLDVNLIPFAPLAQTTILRKKRKKNLSPNSDKTLIETQKMFDSIKVIDRREGFGAATGAGFTIGVSGDARVKRRARAHQDGERFLPRRQFLGITRLDVKAVDSLLRRELQKLTQD